MEPPRDFRPAPRRPVALPDAVVRAIERHLAERHPGARGAALEAYVRRLSDAFTAERSELPGSYLNRPQLRSAYLAHFHPQQVLRGISALEEVRDRAAARGLSPERVPLRVADLGAGLGAMSQALLCTSPAERGAVELTLVDHQKSALRDARDLTLEVARAVSPAAPPPLVRTATDHVVPWLERARREGWRYDLLLAGGLLNEVRGDWEPLLSRALRVLDPDAPGGGLVVLVEPALPPVARRLMELREGLLGATTTIAPCTHGAECPLLALRRDWCFTVRPATLPPRVAALAARLGHQSDEVRYALWAFAGRTAAAPFEAPEREMGRVVSDPMGGEQVVCSAGERVRIPVRGRGAVRGDLARAVPPPRAPGRRGELPG